MKSALAEYFGKTRRQKGMKVVELARLIGYTNVNKGCRRVMQFEDTGKDETGLMPKIANILGISEEVIEELEERDRRAYQEWLSEPIQPSLVVRFLPGFYTSYNLPEGGTQEQAEKVAADVAKTNHMRTCLVWSRRRSIYFDCDGQVERINDEPPAMHVGGRSGLLRPSPRGLRLMEDK